MRKLSFALILTILALTMPRAAAQGVADFYRGKRVNLIVSYGPGGGYDVYARVLARHMGKYIPGNPAATASDWHSASSPPTPSSETTVDANAIRPVGGAGATATSCPISKQ